MKKLIFLLTIAFTFFIISGTSYALSNVALNGVATQSSDYHAYWGHADKAIDGDTNGNYYNRSVTHTNNQFQAWWEVDLLDDFYIDEIYVWNRTDKCQTRLIPSTVTVLDSNRNMVWDGSIWNFPGWIDEPWHFSLFDIEGQYVRVQLDETNYLHLAEVQVFGEPVNPQQSVPEPTTLVLLASSLIGLGFIKRKNNLI